MTQAGAEAALVDRLAASLPPPVTRRETHGAWVLLTADRAWKLRKPVRLAFLDYSTLERRLAACRAEVAVNAALAPGLYLGVRAVIADGDAVRVVPWEAAAEPLEAVVEMRRFDERDTMAARLADGRLTEADVAAVARRLAAFHAGAGRCGAGGPSSGDAFAARVRADLDELAALAAGRPGLDGDALRRFAAAALARRGPLLDERERRGLRRDGHGDLRAEHVVLAGEPLVFDRLEFDPAMRCTDVAGDLAFLTMDLEALGAAWAARALVAAYAQAGGDPGGPGLHAVLAWQRAIVRLKVALLQDDEDALTRLAPLAERLAWRERVPAALLVSGPPASGKSTLAGRIAEAAGLPVVSTDVVRKGLHGVAATTRLGAEAYGEDVTERVYAEVGRRAAEAAREHGGVVVDATARSPRLRRLLLDALDGIGPRVALVCRAAPETLAERARRRAPPPPPVAAPPPAVSYKKI
ncbi:MAG: AAA family ATPase, partial [Solirubrobacteraceae bacterium]|nr:AAA family ATPase [Solirubrobacteraceae bacterium]